MAEEDLETISGSAIQISYLKSINETLKANARLNPSSEWLEKWLKSIDHNLRIIKNILVLLAVLTVIGFILTFCSAIMG